VEEGHIKAIILEEEEDLDIIGDSENIEKCKKLNFEKKKLIYDINNLSKEYFDIFNLNFIYKEYMIISISFS